MKKLLLTAALGLGLGGGAWKYQNPEGTIEDFQTQAMATVDRLKIGAEAVRSSSPTLIKEQKEQQSALANRQEELTQALAARLENLEQVVLSPNDDESESDILALTTATDELRADTGNKLASTAAKLTTTTAKIASAEAKVAAAEARVAAAETNVRQAIEQQANIQQSFGSLESTIDSLQTTVEGIEGSNTEELARVNAIDSRLELLMRRVEEQTFDTDIASVREGLQVLGADVLDIQSTMKAQEASTVSGMASANERADALDNRLNTLASLAQQNKASTESSDNESASAVSGVALASLSAGIDERFGALEDRLATVNDDSRLINGLNEQIDTLKAEIASLKEQSATTDKSIGEISTNIDGLKTANESLSIETVQAEIRDQLASVQSQLENDRAADNSSDLEALIDTTRNRINSLEQRVQELPASSEEADNALQSQSALESQITALEKRLEAINTTDPELASTLSDVQQQIDQLASQSFVTREDLQAQSEGRTVEYKIYFDSNSAGITSGAAKVLKSFIAQEKNRTVGVSIYGFTDRSGSATYNQQLAEQRATNVRSYLIQNGMEYTKIKALTGLGEDAAAAVLPDNAEDSQQRVVVLYAEQP
jgi:outer membrane protein OmpA-like peptidoglycan-associated protein